MNKQASSISERMLHVWKLIKKIRYHINRLKDKIDTTISLMYKSPLKKFQHPLVLKVLEIMGINGTYFSTIKAIYSKATINISQSREKLKKRLLKLGTTTLNNKRTCRNIAKPHLKFYYRAMIIKTKWYLHKTCTMINGIKSKTQI